MRYQLSFTVCIGNERSYLLFDQVRTAPFYSNIFLNHPKSSLIQLNIDLTLFSSFPVSIDLNFESQPAKQANGFIFLYNVSLRHTFAAFERWREVRLVFALLSSSYSKINFGTHRCRVLNSRGILFYVL